MRILVVDDNKYITTLLEKYLKIRNHECVSENDGKTALLTLDEKKFDAIIVDLAMPHFSGIDFVEALRKSGKINKHKIIVLTASNISDDEEKGLIEKGVKAILRKPVKLDIIMKLLMD